MSCRTCFRLFSAALRAALSELRVVINTEYRLVTSMAAVKREKRRRHAGRHEQHTLGFHPKTLASSLATPFVQKAFVRCSCRISRASPILWGETVSSIVLPVISVTALSVWR